MPVFRFTLVAQVAMVYFSAESSRGGAVEDVEEAVLRRLEQHLAHLAATGRSARTMLSSAS